ncbi:MAG: peptidoglycan recognition family protein [Lachnospiraceae bacterium]|nr:peptidoglycan recognition family protein [Lachnospiraceae bacterium]
MSKENNEGRGKSKAGLIVLLLLLLVVLGGVAAGAVMVATNTDTDFLFSVVVDKNYRVLGKLADRDQWAASVYQTEKDTAASEETVPTETPTAGENEGYVMQSDSDAELTASEAAELAESLPEAMPPAAAVTRLSEQEMQELLKSSAVDDTFWEGCPDRIVELLTPNPYSRPQYALTAVNDIVIHYVGNQGSTAKENRDYFESLASSGDRSASSHFIIGLDGEIIQCVPLSEVAYASKGRNYDTISIEVCHPDEAGKFSDATYESVIKLTAWLCRTFRIGPDAVIRHYDVTGKECPKYYVDHEDAWNQLLLDVRTEYDKITA